MRRALTYRLLIGLVVGGFSLKAQDNNAGDNNIAIKNNKIKTQIVYEYTYQKDKPSEEGKKTQETHYDANGNKIEEINYRYNGTIHTINTYKYDSRGNRIEYIKYEGNKEKMVFRQFFEYNSKNQIVTETGFNGVENYKTIYKYDNQGRLAEVIYYVDNKLDEKRTFAYFKNSSELSVLDATLQLSYKIQYVYNEQGKIIREEKTDNSGFVSKRVLYTYDSRGNLLSEEKYMNGKFAQKTTHVYDQAGRLIEVYIETSPSEKFLAKQYVYDAKGLLVEEKYRNSPSKEFSKNVYTYMDNGICKSVDSYYASYNEKIMYVYNYEKF